MDCLHFYSAVAFLCIVTCYADNSLEWWRTAIVYHVYPKSFKDSNGDGAGDLRGITEMADYFKDIGVGAIYLSPIYQSPMVDFGYDISDFREIDPTFGTMEDFEALVAKVKSIGVKLMLDFVPNHTSDKHIWFQKSLQGDPDYNDFYIWKDPKGWVDGKPVPPNNWLCLFGGSSWEWVESKQQFYFHIFFKEQPDLNFRNPAVVGNITALFDFWMDKGVDGFRMDAVKHILENASFPDTSPVPGTNGDTYDTQMHIYDWDQPETFQLMNYWADYVYKRGLEDGKERPLLLEVYDPIDPTMRYYGTGTRSLMYPFNFYLLQCGEMCRASNIKDFLDMWLDKMPAGGVANWVTSNHDNHRSANLYGPEMVDALNMMTMCLPGVKVVYYGEEFGMMDTFVREDQIVGDTRDPFRSPMQWNNLTSAGFSTNITTWLPVNPDYWWLNVEEQLAAKESHLKVFQTMAKVRQDPVLQRGTTTVKAPNNDTLLIIRRYNGSEYALVINVGSITATYTSMNLFAANRLDTNMTVVVASVNSGYSAGIDLKAGSISITLRPKAAILMRSVRSSSCLHHLSMVVLLLLLFTVYLEGDIQGWDYFNK